LAAGELSSPDFIPGSPSPRVFDDLSGLSHIHSIIRAHPSRAVDNYLLDVAAEGSHIKTALVFPPIIYGEGEGPVNRRSIQIPELSRVTLARGHGIRVGQGANRWGNVHVRDVGRLFFALAEAAVSQNSHEMLWGEAGVYLAGVGEIVSLGSYLRFLKIC
jgi:nucleoside-diphosphate-sugar epimerase